MPITTTERDKIAAAIMGADQFYLALGHFVARFSESEALIQTALWEISGLKTPVAQSVLSGVRTEEAMNKINRVAAANKWPEERKSISQAAFSQLGHINKLRNNILHYGANLEGPDTWRITNKDFVHVPENISDQIISPQTLKDAEADLEWIDLLIIDVLVFGTDTKADLNAFEDARKRTWRYTPPPPLGGRQKSRNKTPKQKRRQKSSAR